MSSALSDSVCYNAKMARLEIASVYSNRSVDPLTWSHHLIHPDAPNERVKLTRDEREKLNTILSSPEYKVLMALREPALNSIPDFEDCQWDEETKLRAQRQFWTTARRRWNFQAGTYQRKARHYQDAKWHRWTRQQQRREKNMRLLVLRADEELVRLPTDLDPLTEGEALVLLADVLNRPNPLVFSIYGLQKE